MSLGSIFKLHRKELNISIHEVSSTTDLAVSKLSNFENDKVNFKEDEIINVYRSIGLSYTKHDGIENVANKLFLDLFISISYGKNRDETILEEILRIKDLAQFNNAYITTLVSLFMYYTYHPSDDYKYEKNLMIIQNNLSCLTYEIQQITYDTIGSYYLNKYSWDKAMEYFDLGLRMSISDNALAMLYYHKGMILKNMSKLSESLSCIEDANRLFNNELNQKRVIRCNIILGTIYTRLGRFSEAEKVNLQCISAIEDNPICDIAIVYNNLIWNYVLSENYDKALEFSKKDLKISKYKASHINFFQAFSSWKLGKTKDAKEQIQTALYYQKDASDYMKCMISAFDAYLSDSISIKRKEKYLLQTLNEASKICDTQLQVFVLKFLTTLDFTKDNYKKQIEYRDRIITLLEESR